MPTHVAQLDRVALEDMPTWLEDLAASNPNHWFDIRILTPVRKVRRKVERAAAELGLIPEWDPARPGSLRFRLRPNSAASMVARPSGIVCRHQGLLSPTEAAKFSAECLASALLARASTSATAMDKLRDWSIHRSGVSILFLPPDGLDPSVGAIFLRSLARRLGQAMNATGAGGNPFGGQAWEVAVTAQPADMATAPHTPLAALLEPTWGVRVAGQRKSSALSGAVASRVEVISGTPDPGRGARLRWAAELGNPYSWTPERLGALTRRVDSLAPTDASMLARFLHWAIDGAYCTSAVRSVAKQLAQSAERIASRPLQAWSEQDWAALAREAVQDPARMPALLACMADALGVAYAYCAPSMEESFVLTCTPESGGEAALEAAVQLEDPRLAREVWPLQNESFVRPFEWLSRRGQPRLSRAALDRIERLVNRWEAGLRERRARGARGPNAYVVVDLPMLRGAGLSSVAFITSDARSATVRLEMKDFAAISAYVFAVGSISMGLRIGAYGVAPRRLVLDCFITAVLYDMCVAGIRYPSNADSGRLRAEAKQGDKNAVEGTSDHRVEYLPTSHAYSGTRLAHAAPAPHDVTWFIRRLPPGSEASDLARAHARQYGIELRPGETFVLPHERGGESSRLEAGRVELRSTVALAQLHRALEL